MHITFTSRAQENKDKNYNLITTFSMIAEWLLYVLFSFFFFGEPWMKHTELQDNIG